ncbi:glycosyl transferase, group 1 [Sulfurimonas gotlandica GD1]|uniref:Glycosyl transferase, group 1 n=1 Tax=Sulfurimonas gotlandica (strain DSM 19862 / JCM 16533 / GD1) TaxID=929558 RepID=B6BKG5_SULGG|nr:glycosyltransferase family 1 protein [Sulfurimonas gotlandica]EDZ62399.1 A-glycosyltransferase, glycosyltransferase family 4 protein [Sulfurimonas gotlandica GD1]EHP29020.1 glycosyl transferase, group 1 [Sulfurimonas gotlandica GD1]
MKILFDHQIFLAQKYGGISRYFVELVKKFDSLNQKYSLPVYYSNNVYLEDIKKIKPFQENKFSKKLFSYMGRLIMKKYIKENSFDIFHPTYYDPYFLKSLQKPYVLTIYDFMHEKFKDMFSSKDMNIAWKKECAMKADRIIAISENTKQDIIKYYGISADKIDVVYLSSSLKIINEDLELSLPEKYILFVGNRSRYKNFNAFIKAVAPLLYEENELNVICAGGGAFSKDEEMNLKELGIMEKVKYFNIDDKILANLYQKAICFVFPSLYEGFGIPVLEAFNCGCPVALSNQGSLPEVGGDAVEYFDPNSLESILRAVKSLYYDNSRREELKQLGTIQAKKFSWEKTAQQTIAVYNKLL